LRRALALHTVELRTESMNFQAETLLLDDARLEAVDIERDHVGARRFEGTRKVAQQCDAPFE
jgi:hypothetical protein